MINDYFHLLEKLSNAVILTDINGNIIKLNKAMFKILNELKFNNKITNILEIDKGYHSGLIREKKKLRRKIAINNLSFYADLYYISDEKFPIVVYIFDESVLTSRSFEKVVSCIDDIVIVANGEGVYEKGNEAIRKMLGYDPKDLVGKTSEDMVEMNITQNPISREVVKSKKTETKLVEYESGKSIIYTAIPFFNDEKQLTKIIMTGRDVSKLVSLQKELKEAEKLKDEYYDQLVELKKQQVSENIVYSSKELEKLLNIARRVAKSDSSVFITGESGVGKEEIAKFVHSNSDRKDAPFIAVNCAAIPSELMESEFFGYEEGAFSGAKKGGKKGLFEEVNGGTIFLDEIGELPLLMQSKLLRVIQEGTLRKIGGKKLIAVDIRYISATNLTKKQLSNNLKFRQDLYYRLGVIPLRVPSLRERKDDILPLIQHFLNYFNSKYGRSVSLAKTVIQKLVKYDWPGNVRELKNIIERLCILAEGNVVGDDEYDIVTHLEDDHTEQDDIKDIYVSRIMDINEAHRIVDELLIKKALEEHGTIVKAAKVLGIDPSTIHRKIKKGYDVR